MEVVEAPGTDFFQSTHFRQHTSIFFFRGYISAHPAETLVTPKVGSSTIFDQRKKRWNAQDERFLREGRAEGLRWEDLALKLDRTVQSCMSKWNNYRQKSGLIRSPIKWSTEGIEFLNQSRAAGRPIKTLPGF